MRFLVDAQLPPALARRLESLGHRAEHVADQGMNSRRVALLDRVEAELPAIVAALERGETLIEVV